MRPGQAQHFDRHRDHGLVQIVDGGAQCCELVGEIADVALGGLHQAEQLAAFGVKGGALGGGGRGDLCKLGP